MAATTNGLTLDQAHKLSTDTLQSGVVETFAQTSPVLEMLPFMTVAGNSYQYNVEDALPDVAFRDVNKGYEPSAGTVSQKQESLVLLGGDVDVDRFIAQTLGNINNQRAIQTNMKVKSLAKQFTKTFFKGDGTGLEFEGLDSRIEGFNQEIDAGSTSLTLAHLHELLDAVEGGADVLFMTKAMRRELQGILEGQQHYIQVGKDAFGRPIEYFGDVQIRTVEDDVIPAAETGGDIYAVKFGAQEYVSGITNGGVDVRDLGELDSLPVFRTRIEFYCGLAQFHPKASARLKNVVRAAEVTP